ncbi:MAG: bifunctional phosphopantothenoylcysteine decarboxylase/phosphopantothenate--cysteine ligase CoaBC [Opitutales bacterium]
MTLEGKHIVLGVTGSIAAYKAADIASQLVKLGARVRPVMTASATRFITPLALQTIARHPVASSLWEEENEWQPGHIELADSADLLLVAPATAATISRFAHGLADDLLTCIYLATPAPTLLAPAMNGKMLAHAATQANLEILRARGHGLIEPGEGMLACGYEGQGKLATVERIVEAVKAHFAGRISAH